MSNEVTRGSSEGITLKTIDDLRGHHFEVKDYQRGYKWNVQQVLDLLNDIHRFDTNQPGFYCLQPVVVKALKEPSTEQKEPPLPTWELIDGQQRLTTLFILLTAVDPGSSNYTLDYDTRPASREFLQSIGQLTDWGYALPTTGSNSKLLQEVRSKWTGYVKGEEGHDNVDNYHFFQAYHTIKAWWKHELREDAKLKKAFLNKVRQHTKVIWYEPQEAESAEDVFMKINSGKIPLTSAELIKALFLLNLKDPAQPEISQLKQNQLALEWDYMEQALQQEAFWHFVSNQNLPTHMDLLFDLAMGKEKSFANDYAYRQYDQYFIKRKSGNTSEDKAYQWQRVKELYQKLREWFEDREVFHLAGFLIYEEFKTLGDLVSCVEGKDKEPLDKHAFKKQLHSWIGDKMKEDRYQLDQLSYDDEKKPLHTVLRLFNILSYQHTDPVYRFPFHHLKTMKWSLEHIFPQNPREFKKKEELQAWLQELVSILELAGKEEKREGASPTRTSPFNPKGLEEIVQLQEELENSDETGVLDSWRTSLDQIVRMTEPYLDVHGIGNMALLDRSTNSALGNVSFGQKREKLLELEKKASDESNREKQLFVPLCTRNVFFKYYTPPTEQAGQGLFWSQKDRQNYQQAIQEKLDRYLTSENAKA